MIVFRCHGIPMFRLPIEVEKFKQDVVRQPKCIYVPGRFQDLSRVDPSCRDAKPLDTKMNHKWCEEAIQFLVSFVSLFYGGWSLTVQAFVDVFGSCVHQDDARNFVRILPCEHAHVETTHGVSNEQECSLLACCFQNR